MAELGSRPEVLVDGGGVAALEMLMALRGLAGDRVGVTRVRRGRRSELRGQAGLDLTGAAPVGG